jgi:hypothetical protein
MQEVEQAFERVDPVLTAYRAGDLDIARACARVAPWGGLLRRRAGLAPLEDDLFSIEVAQTPYGELSRLVQSVYDAGEFSWLYTWLRRADICIMLAQYTLEGTNGLPPPAHLVFLRECMQKHPRLLTVLVSVAIANKREDFLAWLTSTPPPPPENVADIARSLTSEIVARPLVTVRVRMANRVRDWVAQRLARAN